MIVAYAKAGRPKEAGKWLQRMLDSNVNPDTIACNAVLLAYANPSPSLTLTLTLALSIALTLTLTLTLTPTLTLTLALALALALTLTRCSSLTRTPGMRTG